MPEAGGCTTQSGIYYQNSIAALHLGRMLDLRQRAEKHRVINVRLEAPENVDDIVIKLSDGSTTFIQAKESITKNSKPWNDLWKSFVQQLSKPSFLPDDKLQLSLGEFSNLAKHLRECCERTDGVNDQSEYFSRLTIEQKEIFKSISNLFKEQPNPDSLTLHLLSKTVVEIIPSQSLDRDFTPLWMPESSIPPNNLITILRDLAGGKSRTRGSFNFITLQSSLIESNNILIKEPNNWGAVEYRNAVSKISVIDIPGTNITKSINNNFPWPKASRYDANTEPDFDDESFSFGLKADYIDLSQFPTFNFDNVIVISGAGLGKSVLTKAIAKKSIKDHKLPVIISIPDLSRTSLEIGDYLKQNINTKFSVNIDWLRAAESGLLILLLDGLDEVSTSSRTLILERIKVFVARYPKTPWLLTVRDASALNAPTNATLVELESLTDSDIINHISFYRPDEPCLGEQLLKQLELHPDVHRLSRIPLFLALLIATLKPSGDLPKNRAELLENYLELLFNPEQFKTLELQNSDSFTLRNISQLLAFDALEREQIGITSRLLANSIHKITEINNVLIIKEQLITHGILRKISPSMYVFPFPIIQEYLAACHISDNHINEISERLNFAIKRPWAQAIQFVLEQHTSPNDLVHSWLNKVDDIFNTNLRLIARCIANGMQVENNIKQDVTKKLTQIWPTSSWRSQRRIGELICEISSNDLFPELRKLLSNRYLLNEGAGSIVVKINDNTLTESVLNELLDGDIEFLYHLYELQPAVDSLGNRALEIYLNKASQVTNDDREIEAISSLIEDLKPKNISQTFITDIYNNQDIPNVIRLALLTIFPNLINKQALNLVDEALTVDSYMHNSIALKVLSCTSHFKQHCQLKLTDTSIPLEQREFILEHFHQQLSSTEAPSFLYELAHNPKMPKNFKDKLLVYSARFGGHQAMRELVNNFSQLPFKVISASISILGYHRSLEVAKKVIDYLKTIKFTPNERVQLTSSLVTGTLYEFEMYSFQSGALKPVLPHPGLNLFKEQVVKWAQLNDYEPIDGLQIYADVSNLGEGIGLSLLTNLIIQLVDSGIIDFTDNKVRNDSHILGRAIDTLKENKIFLSIDLLEKVALEYSYNAGSSAILMLSAVATRDAFDALIRIYSESTYKSTKNVAKGSLENLAGRLGLHISKEDKELKITPL
jgi:hypothetical protein